MMSTTIANDTFFREDARAEKNLWIAVLGQAIDDAEALARKVWRDPDLRNDPQFQANARSLTGYFQDESIDPGRFGFICDLMGVNPGQTVKRIHDKYLRHLTPVTDRPIRKASISAA